MNDARETQTEVEFHQAARPTIYVDADIEMGRRIRLRHREKGKDITSGFLPGCIMLVMDEFGFDRVEEALHRTVVIAVALRATISATEPS
jgi:hypothetical protein